jgi:Spy/CpxP family protein refolding chaperone
MRSRTLFLLTTLLALTALAVAAGARPPFGGHFRGPHGGQHHERFLEKYADRLDVDDETREQIEGKFASSREEAAPLREELHDAHRTLREMLHADEPDRDAILAQADRIGALDTLLRKLRLTTLLEVSALLSDQQRAEMISIREEHKQSRIEPMLEACAGDVEALCPETEDPRSLFHCMRENRNALSESCRSSLRGWKRGHGRGLEGAGVHECRHEGPNGHECGHPGGHESCGNPECLHHSAEAE